MIAIPWERYSLNHWSILITCNAIQFWKNIFQRWSPTPRIMPELNRRIITHLEDNKTMRSIPPFLDTLLRTPTPPQTAILCVYYPSQQSILFIWSVSSRRAFLPLPLLDWYGANRLKWHTEGYFSLITLWMWHIMYHSNALASNFNMYMHKVCIYWGNFLSSVHDF